jgi:predicted anti-sigma-YlaC factor YlaD
MAHESCRALLMELSDYLDETAPDSLCVEIERHMAGCPDCRIVVDTLRRTISLYRQMPITAMPEEARKRLYKALDLADFCSPPK